MDRFITNLLVIPVGIAIIIGVLAVLILGLMYPLFLLYQENLALAILSIFVGAFLAMIVKTLAEFAIENERNTKGCGCVTLVCLLVMAIVVRVLTRELWGVPL